MSVRSLWRIHALEFCSDGANVLLFSVLLSSAHHSKVSLHRLLRLHTFYSSNVEDRNEMDGLENPLSIHLGRLWYWISSSALFIAHILFPPASTSKLTACKSHRNISMNEYLSSLLPCTHKQAPISARGVSRTQSWQFLLSYCPSGKLLPYSKGISWVPFWFMEHFWKRRSIWWGFLFRFVGILSVNILLSISGYTTFLQTDLLLKFPNLGQLHRVSHAVELWVESLI